MSLRSTLRRLALTPVIREAFLGYNGGILKANSSFVDLCLSDVELRNADFMIAHDCFALQAAAAVSRRNGIPFNYDIVDYPFMHGRTGGAYTNLPVWGRRRIDAAHAKAARFASGYTTISEPMAEFAKQYFPKPIGVFQNSLPAGVAMYDSKDTTGEIREILDFAKCGPTVCVFGTHFPGDQLPETLMALKESDSSIRLLIFGKFQSNAYKSEIINQINALPEALQERIRIFGYVPSELLYDVLSVCDASVLMWDLAKPNLKLGLPNRFWSSVQAGLPVSHSGLEAINSLAHRYKIPDLLQDVGKGSKTPLPAFLKKVCTGELTTEKMRNKIKELGSIEHGSDKEKFFNAIGRTLVAGNCLAVLSRTSLENNGRVARYSEWLYEIGIKVIVISMELDQTGQRRWVKKLYDPAIG